MDTEEAYLPSEDILEVYDLEDATRPETSSNNTSTNDPAEESDEGDSNQEDGEVDINEQYEQIQHQGIPPIVQFEGHYPAEVYSVSAVGKNVFVSGGEDDQLLVWTVDGNGVLQVLGSDQSTDSCSSLLVVNGHIVSGWLTGCVKVHKLTENGLTLTHQLEGIDGEVQWLKASESQLAAGGSDGSVWIWDLSSMESVFVYSGNGQASTCADYTSEGVLICADAGGSLFILADGQLLRRIHVANSPISALKCHPQQKSVLVGTEAGELYLCPFQGPPKKLPGHSDSVESAVYAQQMWLSGSIDGSVKCFSEVNLQERFTVHFSGVTHMSTHGNTLYIGCEDGVVLGVDVRSGQRLSAFESDGAPVLCLVVCEGYLMVGTGGGHVRLYPLLS